MSPIIALDALAMGNPPQGIGTYMLNVARCLQRRPGSYSYLLFAPRESLTLLENLDSPHFRIVPCALPPGRWGRVFFQHRILPHLARRHGAGLLHGLANLLPRAWRGPSVVTIHDLDFLIHPEHSSLLRRLLFHWSTPSSLSRAGVVVTISSHSAAELRRSYPGTAQRLRIVPNGAPPMETPSPAEIGRVLRRYDLERERYLLTVGTVERRKNLLRALEAFRGHRDLNPGARFVLAGSGGYGEAEILRRAGEMGVAADILVTGYVPPADLPSLYAGAFALLFLSEAEGFGLPALEAMSCRCPVVAARAGALPETCGDAAILCDPARTGEVVEALERLKDHPFRELLLQAGRRNLQRFSWEAHATALQDAYGESLAGGWHPRAASRSGTSDGVH
jgi:alpha-1,3-rhamnosyl/mannosyltransferase